MDAYDFVKLHQPSAYYGVNSKPMEFEVKRLIQIYNKTKTIKDAIWILIYFF